MGKHLHDRHLTAESLVDAGELDSDGAGAEHDEALGDLGVLQQLIGGDDALAVHLQSGNEPRRGAGSEDDVLRLDHLIAGGAAGDGNAARTREARVAMHAVHLVLAEEELDAFRALRDDRFLVLDHIGHLEFDARDLHSLVGRLLRVLVQLGGVQDRLGRDAPAQRAGAA